MNYFEMYIITLLVIIKPWFNDDGRLAFDSKQEAHLQWTRDRSRVTGMSFSITRGMPMLYMPRLCVSLVSEAGLF